MDSGEKRNADERDGLTFGRFAEFGQTAQNKMVDRISAYESSAEEIEITLFYEENITQSEKDNALVALARIVAYLQQKQKEAEAKSK